MEYIGLHTQIRRNNLKSICLLAAFPILILGGVFVVLFFLSNQQMQFTIAKFLHTLPYVLGIVGIWFVLAFLFHSKMIQLSTRSNPIARKNDMRIYNLTENLCMSIGMKMPKLFVIETDALNAFASGINEKTYAVTLTRGIINQLNDEELKGVIAHELTHIRNKDVRLLIVTIVFVGIFGVIVDITFRNLLFNNLSRRRDDKGSGAAVILIILVVAIILYFLSMIFKFALSRSREYMADAGAVEITKNADALANALRKISGNSTIKTQNDEVKELFIDNSVKKSNGLFSAIGRLFATHPPIENRIKVLEQY